MVSIKKYIQKTSKSMEIIYASVKSKTAFTLIILYSSVISFSMANLFYSIGWRYLGLLGRFIQIVYYVMIFMILPNKFVEILNTKERDN